MQSRISLFVCLLALTMSACRPQMRIEDPTLQEACRELWSNVRKADSLYEAVDPLSLSSYEQHRRALLKAHLDLKLRQTIDGSTDLKQIASWFLSHDDDASAAEAFYIAGAYANWQDDNAEAMRMLKEAESLHPTGIIGGMTYYKMGRISEAEQLYEVALEYYDRAVRYIEPTGLPLYQACAWRELGRTRNDSTSSDCFREALRYARQTGDSLLCLDIRYAAASLAPGNREAISISRFLCDSAGISRYAYDLVKHYIRSGRADSAKHYLSVLAKDTVSLQWSANQYTLWESRYKHLTGQDAAAYSELLGLYNRLYDQTEQENRTQTFAIAQRYDNEAERAKNLQLRLEKQRLYFSLAVILALVLLGIALSFVFISRRRTQHLLEQAEKEQQIAGLKTELQLRRDALRRVLEQRIALTKNLQETVLHKHQEGEVPEWAQEFIQQNIFSTGQQWQAFRDEFNGCYGNRLEQLQTQYPKLTAVDLQVIALILIGLDTADICLLLGLTQRTVWSRRLRIKQHLGLEDGVELDEWLRSI